MAFKEHKNIAMKVFLDGQHVFTCFADCLRRGSTETEWHLAASLDVFTCIQCRPLEASGCSYLAKLAVKYLIVLLECERQGSSNHPPSFVSPLHTPSMGSLPDVPNKGIRKCSIWHAWFNQLESLHK